MRLFDTDRWSEIFQTISRNKKRSMMTALGIFWGIFMLAVMLGVGAGLERMFRSALGDMSNNVMFLSADQTSIPYKGMPSERWWRFNNDDVSTIKAHPSVLHATSLIFGGQLDCSYETRKGNYSIMGYSPDMQRIQPQPIKFGRYINDIDMAQKRKVCVIGQQVWKELFPGGTNPEGAIIKVGPFYFTVVGVLIPKGNANIGSNPEQTITLPSTLAQQLFGRGNSVDAIALAGDDQTESKVVEQALKEVIFERHIIAPDDTKAIWTISTSDMFSNIIKLFRGISLLTWIVGMGTLLAGIVGVSNIMLVLVKERTQEIGIRRALGARPSIILSQIISESFVLTFITGVLGLAAAVGVLSLVDTIYYQIAVVGSQMPDISWQISFGTAIGSLAILVIGSLAAGVIPAGRALHIKAVDAIREE